MKSMGTIYDPVSNLQYNYIPFYDRNNLRNY